MSSLTDYSKFDHLAEDSDDEIHDDKNENAEKNDHTTQQEATKKTASAAPPKQSDKNVIGGVIQRDECSGRYRFEYNGNTVYEFEQSLDDMTIYVLPPPYVTKGRQINCVISANHFKLGLVGHGGDNDSGKQCQWFLNEGTYGTVDVDESTWTLEDYDGDGDDGAINNNGNRRKIIVVTLTKAHRGTAWDAALRGNPNAGGATNKTNSAGTMITSTTTMDSHSKEQVKKDLMLQRFQEENPGFDFSGADFNGSIPDARDFMGGVKYQ